jgi:hypothetical protein
MTFQRRSLLQVLLSNVKGDGLMVLHFAQWSMRRGHRALAWREKGKVALRTKVKKHLM